MRRIVMRTTTQVWLFAALIALTAFGCSRQHAGSPPGQAAQTGSSTSQGIPPLSHGRDMRAAQQSPSMEAVIPEVKRLVEETVKEPSRAQQVEDLLQELVK